MNYKKLNTDWNADPNAPEVTLSVEHITVTLDFFLNHFVFKQFKENEKRRLVFNRVKKFSWNITNDEGYHRGQYRYKHADLPWGEFYQIDTDWSNDFHNNVIVLLSSADYRDLKHFIFFFKDNTFECVAESYSFTTGYFDDQRA